MARVRKMVICPKCGQRKIIENETEKKKISLNSSSVFQGQFSVKIGKMALESSVILQIFGNFGVQQFYWT